LNARQVLVGMAIIVLSCVMAFAQDAADIRVWNGDVLAPYQDLLLPDAAEPLQPITIVGTRNGSFSGKVVLGSAKPIRRLRAEMGPLECGNHRIPVSAVQVRYPRYTRRGGWNSVAKAVTTFDTLEETAPKEIGLITKRMKPGYWDIGKVKFNHAYQPIWVTVTVPTDAAPGDYRSSLRITVVGAKPVVVPVKLKVCPWKLPDAENYETYVDFVQSPESVALRYEVPLWSDRHFKLMEKSLALLGRSGNRSVYIPLICETNFGHDQTMVRWIREGNGYRYDFTVMEKYLDMVEKHMGTPRNVVLYVWDIFLDGGDFTVKVDKKKGTRSSLAILGEEVQKDRFAHRGKGPRVTLLDPATGRTEKLWLPQYRDPKAHALWKPLLAELQERLNKRGLGEAVALGMAGDAVPAKPVIDFFKTHLPRAGWMIHTHGFYGGPKRLKQRGALTRHITIVFVFDRRAPRSRFYEWDGSTPGISFYPRGRPHNVPISDYRASAELNASGQLRGFGRVGADFWPVLKDKRGRRRGRISMGRFPKSRWRNLDIRQTLLEPGPEGALSTVRFEMTCEGIQESEARIFVESALVRKKISGELAKRCKRILDERDEAIGITNQGARARTKPDQKRKAYETFIANWQIRSEKLFDLAADVAKALERE